MGMGPLGAKAAHPPGGAGAPHPVPHTLLLLFYQTASHPLRAAPGRWLSPLCPPPGEPPPLEPDPSLHCRGGRLQSRGRVGVFLLGPQPLYLEPVLSRRWNPASWKHRVGTLGGPRLNSNIIAGLQLVHPRQGSLCVLTRDVSSGDRRLIIAQIKTA